MHLKPDDEAKVAAAIKAAEARTDGEISTIVAGSSDSYNDVVLHWALLFALLPLAISAAWPALLFWGASLLRPWDDPSLRLILTLLLVKMIAVFLIAIVRAPGTVREKRLHILVGGKMITGLGTLRAFCHACSMW